MSIWGAIHKCFGPKQLGPVALLTKSQRRFPAVSHVNFASSFCALQMFLYAVRTTHCRFLTIIQR